MRIPERLTAKLSQNQALYGATLETVGRFTSWIGNSNLVFFPAYTAHGLGHFEDVLSTASDLISESALAIITPIDVAIIIHSVILHDCGMHLSEDGFLTLIELDQMIDHGKFFGDAPWPLLWTKFQEESRRFSGRILREIYGDEQPPSPVPPDPREWTEKHRMMIGEFIRRNHTRLAHDIALRGLPGHSRYLPLLSTATGQSFADMAGVVARSHGLDLRPCVDYVANYYDVRDYTGAHLVFDMVVLRIADYLQIQSNRAPQQYSDIKRIRSPLSANEWKVHQSVLNIHQTHGDPEAVFVQALPVENKVYLRLSSWLSDLQSELDKSWAILGEVYGRYREQGLDRLGLRIRRIRSNLDDVAEFAKTVEYIPAKVRLSVDNVEVLGLLVNPLYDDNVVCGIRELVQNSVDAVREMEELIKSGLTVVDSERVQCQGDVDVSIRTVPNGPVLTVRDRGLGMPLDVLRDYFLRAGASYRRSDQWRQHFEDQAGASKILRSGRFGVGVLAAFLLGECVTVRSRSALERDAPGYELTAFLNDDSIEIRRCDTAIGTQIEIPLAQAAFNSLDNLDKPAFFFQDSKKAFYALRKPQLHFEVDGRTLTPPYFCAQPSDEEGWHSVVHRDYDAIYWRNGVEKIPTNYGTVEYDRPFNGTFCNGIWIPGAKASHEKIFLSGASATSYARPEIEFRFPQVSIFDANGRLPVNLSRSQVNWEQASCTMGIARSVLLDVIKHMQSNEIRLPHYSHASLASATFPFVLSTRGVTFADKQMLAAAGLSRVLRLSGFKIASVLAAIRDLPPECGIIVMPTGPRTSNEMVHFIRSTIHYGHQGNSIFERIDHHVRLFLISDDLVKIHAAASHIPEYQRRELAEAIHLGPHHTYIEPTSQSDLRHFCEALVRDDNADESELKQVVELCAADRSVTGNSGTDSPSLLQTVWTETFGGPMAPREDVCDSSGTILAFRIGRGIN